MNKVYLAKLKNCRLHIIIICTFFGLYPGSLLFGQTTVPFVAAGPTTWTCPVAVSSVTVECWGGGGAGGGVSNTGTGGGGAGGGYTKAVFAVTPGTVYNLSVGAGGNGGNGAGPAGQGSWFNTSTTLFAVGGNGGGTGSNGAAGAGPTTGNIGGTTNFYGGNGAPGVSGTRGGGGGSSAGTASNGITATNATGAAAVTGGGAGATGTTSASADGGDATTVGGGGGGARTNSTTDRNGGNGFTGKVAITYTQSVTYKSQIISVSAPSTAPWCAGETRNVQVTIKNTGTATWTDANPDINIGVKWNVNGANWADYYVRVDAGGLAPNATQTYTLPVTASNNIGAGYTTPLAAGTNNLIFDLVYEGISWFGDNGGGVGPLNSKFTTSAITINALPLAPTGTAAQTFCTINNPTVANLVATGTTLKWYAAATGGTALATTTPLVSGTHYFASQTNASGCEGTLRFDVTATLSNPAAPTGNASPIFCSINNPTVANLVATGTGIKWYAVASGGTAIVSTTPLVNGTHYYASQTIAGCEGTSRFDVTATVSNPAAPTGTGGQAFCAINTPTVANLSATGVAGSTIQWYAAASGGSALASTTPLLNGTHYFASQTVAGCEGISRFDVTTTVSNPAAPTGTPAQTFCAINTPTIANLIATGVAGSTIQWYAVSTGGTALASTTPLVSGTHYYASQTVTGCEGISRFNVTATISDPAAPTGAASQSFCSTDNPTVANLTATGTGIQWYSASTGGTALAPSTPLTNGTHYYASQTITGCEGLSRFNVTVVVNTAVVITTQPSPTPQIICASFPVTFSVTATGDITGYQWYLGTNPLSDNASISGSQTASLTIDPVTTSDAGLYHVVINGTAPCANVISADAELQVNTNIIISSQPAPQTLCVGNTATFTVATSTGTGLTYQWRKGTANLTDGGDISGATSATLSIANITPATAGNYNVIVSDGSFGCPNVISTNAALTVNVTSVGGTVSTSATKCSGTNSGTLTLTGKTGTVQNWESSTDGITYTTIANTGTTQTYNNLTQTTWYRVVVKSGVCPSDNAIPAIITINPIPDAVATPAAQSICSGSSIANIALTGSVSGTTFNWTRNNTTVTGIAASGSGDISGTLTNSTAAPITVTFTITPTANTCIGSPITATVIVNPIPAVTNTFSNPTYCNGLAGAAVNFTSNVASGVTYNWTSTVDIGFGTSGTGNIAAYTATNAGNAAVTATITVTASANLCSGSSKTFNVTVTPTSAVTNTFINPVYCAGVPGAAVAFTSNVSGATFAWTSTANVGFGTSGTGNISAYTTINATNTPIVATVTVTASTGGCAGPSKTFTVTVNPTPAVTNTFSSPTYCNGLAGAAVNFTSNVASGVTYNWTSTVDIGFGTSGTGNINAYTATNAGNTAVTTTVTVTASANSCSGSSKTFTVTVTPTSTVTNTFTNPVYCTGVPGAAVAFTSNVSGATFAWTSTANVGFGTSGTGNISAYTTINATNTPIVATVTVTASTGGCAGPSKTFTVTVNPTPAVTNTFSSPTYCNGLAGAAVNFTSNVASGVTYNWTSTVDVGFGTSGTGNIAAYTATNAGNTAVTTTVTVTASANSCSGSSKTFNVTVSPGAPATPGTISGIVAQCPGLINQTYSISTVVRATTYTWTVPAGWTITGGQGTTSITVTTGVAAQNGNVGVTAGNSCGTSTASSVAVIVNPGTPAQPGAITGSGTVCPNVSLTYSIAAIANATTYTWTVPTGWSITSGQGSTSIVVNTGTTGQNGNIKVTAGNSCGTSSGNQSIDITPVNGTNNTGYTDNNGPKISDGMSIAFGSTRGYLKFPLSAIPAGSTITSSELDLTNNGTGAVSGVTNLVTGLGNNDPVSVAAATLYNLIGSGTTYNSSTWNNTGTIALTLNAAANADIQANISSPGYLALGLNRGNGSTTYLFYGYSGGANAPVLTVNYSIPGGNLPVIVSPGTPAVPGTITGAALPCKSTSGTYSIAAVTNATSYTWTVPTGWSIMSGQGTTSITATSGTIGQNGNITVTASNSCGTSTAKTLAVTVNQDASISLNSSSATTSQTLCINTAITPITYLIGGSGTSATFTGPAGLSGSYNSGTKIYTVSGSPTVSGGPFTYTVTTTGPCTNVSLSGTVTVTPDATISLTSAAGTDAQQVCLNSGLTDITYAIGGSGTSATVSGLPTGVNGNYSGGVFTISGTPSVSGTFNYTVVTTGPCVKPGLSGTITVKVLPTGTFTATETSGTTNNDNTICQGSTVTFTFSPAGIGSYIFKVNGAVKQTGTSNIFSTSTLNNADNVTVDVANSVNCGATFGPITITVSPLPTPTLTATENSGTPNNNVICAGDNVTFTAGGGIFYNFKVNGSSVQSGALNTYSTTTLTNGASVTVDATNANGCIATSAAQVLIVNSLPSGTLSASATTICAGGSITFTATAGFSNYNFKINNVSVQSTSSNTFTSASLANGNIVTVDVTNAGGCVATFTPANVITVNALPVGSISVTENSGIVNDNSICSGSSVTFTATPGFSNYKFYLNGASTPLQNGSSNTYSSTAFADGDVITAVVTNAGGCSSTFTSAAIIVVTSPSGTLSASPSSICAGDNIVFIATAGFANYSFQVNGSTVQNGSSNTYSSTALADGDVISVDVTNSNTCVTTFNAITLTVHPLPTGILVPVENSGNTANDGIICDGDAVVFTAPTGFTNYDFILNGATVQSSASNTYANSSLSNGDNVTVALTNSNGCIGLSNAIAITVNPVPAVAPITGSVNICLNSTTTLADATAGGVWSSLNITVATIDAAGIVTGIAPGTATINYTFTNSNGCSATATATITVNAPPTVAAISGNFNLCVGGTSPLTDATIGGTWSSNNISVVTIDASGIATGVSAGTATVSYLFTDANGCSTTVTADVTVNTVPFVAAITGATSVCQNNTTSLSDITTGGVWGSSNTSVATISTSGIVTGLSAGTTTITYSVTDACSQLITSSITFIVNPKPAVVITNPLAVCSPSTADLTAATVTAGSTSGLTFTYWTNAVATIAYATPATAGAGTYYIKGTTTSGCFDIQPVTVTVNPSPTVLIANPPAVCAPLTVDLTSAAITAGSTSGLTYSYWTDAAASISYPTPATAGAGTYYIKGTTAAGCFDIKPVTVTVNPVPTVTPHNPAAVCFPSTVDITLPAVTSGSTAGLTYTYWTNAAATIMFITPTTAGAGTYYIKGTTASGCSDIQPVTVTVNPSPVLVITNPAAVCAPSTINITLAAVTAGSTPAGLTFSYWTNAAATTSYSTPTTATAGTYYIKGTAAGCSDIKPVTVTVNPLPTAVVSGTATACLNGASPNITFTGAGGTAPYTFTYKINAGGPLTVTSVGNVATVAAPTSALGTFTYTLISVKDASSGACTQNQGGTATVTVTSATAITAVTATPSAICLGNSSSLLILPSSAGPIFSENFEGTSTFTVVATGANVPASAWINRASPYKYTTFPIFDNGSKFMLANSDDGAGNTNTALVSPSANTIGFTSLTLTYSTYYKADNADVAEVEVSINNGTTWTSVQSLTTTIGGATNFVTQTISLNSYINNASLIVRFRYSGFNQNWWAVDDVKLTGTSSPYNYSWTAAATAGLPAGAGTPSLSNANIVVTPTVTGPSVYTATLTNGAGCTSTSNVTLTVNPLPTVNITADYCVVPGKVRLTANGTAGVSYLWNTGATTQSIDVDIAGEYDVSVSLGTGCIATATIDVAQELVVNGDFTNGNTGFTSDYAYHADVAGLVPAGQGELYDDSGNNGYSITTSGQNVHVSFYGLDHTGNTTGARNFMAVNGHQNTLVVWKETVSVLPNTTYYFSAWAMSLNASPTNAQLRFSVNGVFVGTTAVLADHGMSTTSPDNWTRFYGTWTSGPTVTSAAIYINDLQSSFPGNDFGLDDVSFGTLSTFVQLESAPGTDAQTPCINTPITPIVYSVGSTASGPTITGLPPGMSTSFNGVLFTISGTPTVPGNYTYTVTTTGTCLPSTATGTIKVQTQTISLTSGSAAPLCVNTALPTLVYTTGGTATGASITSGALPTGVTGSYDVPTKTFNITGTPTVAGIFNYTITTSGTCTPAAINGTITVQSQTITLNSANSIQTVCINSPVSNIQYTVGGTGNNATVTGLPAGLSGSYGGGLFIISGTATASGTFNYTVTTSGTCAGITATGTIYVTPVASLTLTSGTGTDAQTVCKGNAINNITYTVNNGTGASVTGLPAGVSGLYNNGTGVFTISGAPTAIAGTYNYTVTTSGGCGAASATGLLIVQAQTISLTSGSVSPSLCANTLMTDIVYTIGGTATSATVSSLPTGITGSLSGNVFTITGTPTAAAGAYPYVVTTSGSCGQVTASGTITVTAAPVGGTLTSLLLCSGSSGSITLAGKSGNVVRWEMSTDGGTTWTVLPTNTTITQSYSNITQPTMYRVAVTSGGCNTVYSTVGSLSIRNLWTGGTSTDWNVAGNWSGNTLPSLSCPDVYIPAGTPNQPILGYGTATINNIHILPGANLVVNGSGTLQVAGVISNAGIFNAGNGAIEFNGTSPQTIALNTFMNNAVRDLVISNSTATGVTLAGPLDVYRSVNYGAAGKNLNTAGFLTLKSTATETAWLGNMTGHTIVGDVTVERYIATGTGSAPNHGKSWQMLATPTTGQTIKNAWQEGATATNVSSPAAGSAGNPNAGYGTMLTSDVANAAIQPTPGFDALTASGASIKVYNSVSDSYTSVVNTQAPIYNQKGYFIFVRGDRSVSSAFAAAVPTVLRTKGTLFTPANLPPVNTVIAGKFESIGNPYASAVDKRNIIKTGGVDEFFYVWDPRLGSVTNYGAFQTFSKLGSDYVVTPGGGSYGAPGSINNYIQSGQAFLVQATGSNGTVSFNENSKANGSALITVQNPIPSVRRILRTSLTSVNTDGSSTIIDGTFSSFDDDYSNAVDQMDAKKSFNMGENLSIKTAGKLLVIERRNILTQKDTIFLNLTGTRVQSYQFRFDAENVATGLAGFLEDNYLHTRTPLSLDGSTVVNFSIANVPGSYANNRFRIIFEPNVVLPVTFTAIKAYRQDKNINVEWKVENEMNIKQYEVEKSVNGTNFTTLVVWTATANGGHSASYAGTDVNPVEGNNYYRVKSVDLYGKTAYTNVVKVQMGSIKQDITIYPNPITDGMIHLQLMNQPEGKYDIRLLNKLGQVILSRQINHAEGNGTELIKWDFNLAHGMYQLEVIRPDGSNKVISVMY